MNKLRRLLDRSLPQIPTKAVSVGTIRSQRDSIQNLLNGRDLETFGKAVSAAQLVVLPCLESIQEDLFAIQAFGELYANAVVNSKIILELQTFADSRFPKDFTITMQDFAQYSETLSKNIGIPTYLLLCKSQPYVSISKSLPKVLRQSLNLIDAIEAIPSAIGDILSNNSSRAVHGLDYWLTSFAVDPIYGRQSDTHQLRALENAIKDLQYCDPIGVPPDFWSSYHYVLETDLFKHDESITPAQTNIELGNLRYKIKSWNTSIKRTTHDYVGNSFNHYLSALMDRALALTYCAYALRLLSECVANFSLYQSKTLAGILLKRTESGDYDLILDEINGSALRLN